MIKIDSSLTAAALRPLIGRVWPAAAAKIRSIDAGWAPAAGAPVFTVQGRYTSRGWTEWTQGFQFGAAILVFDATHDAEFLHIGRQRTVEVMAPHITHIGVHDHGFNNVSTYGNLLRLLHEGQLPDNRWERSFYELALKCSGAVQAARWARIRGGGGYIYSFNGPQSLFVDTIRSLRALACSWRLGHVLMGENDVKINLLGRLIDHARATAEHSVFYGEGRDAYDVRGRTAHEIIFNPNDGNRRCPNSQQGYSPFSTWTRGLAWAMCGFAEQLEFLATVPDEALEEFGGRTSVEGFMRKAAEAVCEFYVANTPTDGIPYWDTGAPGLAQLGNYLERPADPFNDHEPVDSSAAAIAAQGLLRFGRWLMGKGEAELGARLRAAGLATARTLLAEPYLSEDPEHQGLLLHAVYHRPNDWDHIPDGCRIPFGESCMWGDYHLLELALYLQREADGLPYLTFWS
jgi:hypothetical protein